MIFGLSTFGMQPFGLDALDFSVPSPFTALIQDQDAPRAYLLRATPFDPVAGDEIEFRASLGLKWNVLGGQAWPSILVHGADTQVDLFGDEIDSAGRTAFGNIELAIGDQEHDALLQYFWDGRDIEVLMGGPDWDLTEFQRVVRGTAADATHDQRTLSIVFRGRSELLDTPIQQNVYAGTGGLEGGDDIAGREKPLCFGPVPNMTPVLVDRVNQIYHIHDGLANAVTSAYDGAGALTADGEVPDIEAATAPAGGHYVVQRTAGGTYIRLGAEPAKGLTVDVQGDATGGYVQTVADIIRRIAEGHPLLTTDDLDLPAFAAANIDNPAPAQLVVTNETYNQVITDLINSIGGAWTFTRQGELTLAVFKIGTPVGTISSDDIDRQTIQRTKTLIPSWRRKLGYARNWTVQDQNSVIAAASDARKDFVAQEYRYSVDDDATIKTRRKLATDLVRNTCLAEKAGSDAEVVRQQSLFGGDLYRFNFTARNQQFKYRVGQTVTLYHQRLGIVNDVVILGLRETTATKKTEFRIIATDISLGDFTSEFTGEFH